MGDDKTAVTPPVPGKTAEVTEQKPALAGLSPAEEVRRLFQSEFDKRISGVETKILAEVSKATAGIRGAQETGRQVDAVLKRAQEAGLLKEGADIGGLRSSLIQEALTQAQATEAKPEAKPQEEAPESDDPVMREAYALAAQYGLQRDDPELAEIVTGRGVKAYLDSVEAAGKKRQARVGGAKSESTATPTAVDIGTGRVAAANPIEHINDPATLLEMGLKSPPKRAG